MRVTASHPPFGHARILPADMLVEPSADGTIRARSPHPLGPYPGRITDCLERWAAAAPDRIFLAERDDRGHWRRLTYADALRRVRHLAQAFVDRDLSADRTVVILSGNSIEHALVALAAMYCGVPYAPVAPVYSLAVREFTTLRAIVATMRPALVFADNGSRFERALGEVAAPGVDVVVSTGLDAGTSLSRLEATPVTPEVDEAHARVGPPTVAKILFTSGSTGQPKGVINTHGMLCANQEQIRTAMPLLGDAPPVLCDWLPWNHTFGGNHNLGIVLYNGGTLYIDHGRPVPEQMATTIANLRDVAPTAYFNVPRGFEMLLPVLEADADFRQHFFSRLGVLFFAAAGLRSEVADRMQALAIETRGAPIPWVTGLGATETAPFALCTGALLSTTTHVGVPAPGLELKAAPVDGLLEARVKGPNVTPGYWRNEALTREAFDEDGFYKTGDVIAPRDPADVSQGFMFQGRLTEDFKLSTGTWVRVGWLRARLLAALGPLVQDVAIAAPDRAFVGALIFPDVAACRTLAGADVRQRILDGLAQFNDAHGTSSTTIGRAMLLHEPPSIDAMEITDKGSLNQKAVLANRRSQVESLYAATGPSLLLWTVLLLILAIAGVQDVDGQELAKKTYTYKTVGDVRILADVYRTPDEVIRPAILSIHGGALIMGNRSWLGSDVLVQKYLDKGYAIVSIDYRLAPQAKLHQILEDIDDAYRWVRTDGPRLFRIDPNRIAVVGQSAGGYLAQMAGFRFTPRPVAVVSFYGYGDIAGPWYSRPDPFYSRQPAVTKNEAYRSVGTRVVTEDPEATRERFYLYTRQQGLWPREVAGHDPDKEPRAFDPLCPLRNVTKSYPPTLLLHGDKDTDVPFEQSVLMARELERHGVRHEFIAMAGKGHGFDRDTSDPAIAAAFDRVLAFLQQAFSQ